MTGLCHDIGYVELARSQIALPGFIFSGAHCETGAEAFWDEIAHFVLLAFPEMPKEYLADVVEAIRKHEEKYTSENPLNAEDDPLKFLLQMADRFDRVGTRRLHLLQQNIHFMTCVGILANGVLENDPEIVDKVEAVRILESVQIPKACSKFIGSIPRIVMDVYRFLEILLALHPDARDLEFLGNGASLSFIERVLGDEGNGDEDVVSILKLLYQRFWNLHLIDKARWDPGKGNLTAILDHILKLDLPLDLQSLAVRYLLQPFSPFCMYGTLDKDLNSFLTVQNITCHDTTSGPEVIICVCSGKESKVVKIIQKGLNGLFICGKPLGIHVIES